MVGQALAHNLNANMLRKWVIDAEHKEGPAAPVVAPHAVGESAPAFVPLALTSPAPIPAGEIQIELQRAGTTVKISWPAAAAHDCAAWLRDWLR